MRGVSLLPLSQATTDLQQALLANGVVPSPAALPLAELSFPVVLPPLGYAAFGVRLVRRHSMGHNGARLLVSDAAVTGRDLAGAVATPVDNAQPVLTGAEAATEQQQGGQERSAAAAQPGGEVDSSELQQRQQQRADAGGSGCSSAPTSVSNGVIRLLLDGCSQSVSRIESSDGGWSAALNMSLMWYESTRDGEGKFSCPGSHGTVIQGMFGRFCTVLFTFQKEMFCNVELRGLRFPPWEGAHSNRHRRKLGLMQWVRQQGRELNALMCNPTACRSANKFWSSMPSKGMLSCHAQQELCYIYITKPLCCSWFCIWFSARLLCLPIDL